MAYAVGTGSDGSTLMSDGTRVYSQAKGPAATPAPTPVPSLNNAPNFSIWPKAYASDTPTSSTGSTQNFTPAPVGNAYLQSSSSTITPTPTPKPQSTTNNTNNVINPDQMYNINGTWKTGRTLMAEGLNPDGSSTNPTDNRSAIMDEAQRLYDRLVGTAGQIESYLYGQQPVIEGDIRNQGQQNQSLAQTQYDRSGREISTGMTNAEKRAEQAKSQSRQIFNEAGIGYGQRFGANSNIAKALGEYAGTKLQQAFGQARDTMEQSLSQLNEKKMQLEEDFKNTTIQIGNWVTQNINQAKQDLQAKLFEVQSMKDAAATQKSNANIAAIQDYAAKVDAINMQKLQFSQQLAAQRAAADLELRNNAQALSAYGSGANTIDLANASTNANNAFNLPTANGTIAGSGMTSAWASNPGNYTGQIASKKTEDPYNIYNL